jgi:hypothetical protein
MSETRKQILKQILNDNGFAFVTALIIMLLLTALGSAAYMMTNLGFSAITAERRYQLANYAADYAIGAGASYVVEKAVCPPSTSITPCASLASGASCDYFSIPDATQTFCTIYAKGKVGSAEVIKIAVVPRMGSDWGGMVTLGGTIKLSGSSAIAGCDDDEANYDQKCGMMPALIAPPEGPNLEIEGLSTLSELCKTEGKMKGLFGNPPHYSPTLPNDLTPKYFNVTDENNNVSAWDKFLEKLESKYQVDITPLPEDGTISIPSVHEKTCKSEPDQFCCKTASSTQISCFNKNDCTGSPVKTIDLNPNTCPNVKIDGKLLINHSISNANIVGEGSSEITISASISNVNFLTKSPVTVNATLTDTRIITSRYVNINANVQNSNFVSGGTINVGTDKNWFDGTLTNTNFFSNYLNLNFKTSSKVEGGIFYAKDSTTIKSNGSPNFGTVDKPILLLAGNTSLSVPGNLTINGLIYTSATNVKITGAVEIQGSLINNSTNATIENTGNGIIQFNKKVLDNLYSKYSDLINKPKCGGGNKKEWISNTKMTLY